MKKIFYSVAFILLFISFVLYPVGALAAETTEAPSTGNISVTNNAGKYDSIYISSDLSSGDIVKAYNAETGGKLLGRATVGSMKTDATISLSQLGTGAGSVYISVTSKGMLESSRVKVDYLEEPKSETIDLSNVTVTNNVGAADTLEISMVSTGDAIKVYNLETGGKLLGRASVGSNKSDVTVKISQIGKTAGSLYVSITSIGMTEGDRVKVDFPAEATTTAPETANMAVVNNAGAPDTIFVGVITAGDLVRVYNAETGGRLLGKASVAGSKSEATVTVSQLGTAAGSVYVTVTGKGMLESSRVKYDYPAESKTSAPDKNISVLNNSGAADTVTLTGLSNGDQVFIYDAEKGGRLLGKATVSTYNTEATISITQLGTGSGFIYVSVKSKNMQESERLEVRFPEESKADKLDDGNISVINNAGASDTVTVTGLETGDIIKVYNAASGGKLLGTATVAASKSEVALSVSQLGTGEGTVYLTLSKKGVRESDRLPVGYSSESKTAALTANQITTVNNIGTSDEVTVTGLTEKDIIKVYDSATGGKQLATATVASSKTEATATVSQLGSTAGTVHVTLTRDGKQESVRTPASYASESKADSLKIENISIINNSGIADTITVRGLSSGDSVKVYDFSVGGSVLATGTVPSNGTEATASVSQLGSNKGSVYISLIKKGKLESDRLKADYSSESTTDTPSIGNITIVNNAGTSDTINITGVNANSTIKVYDSEIGGALLASAVVPASKTEVTITVTQLGSSAGSVYISASGTAKIESTRVKVDYLAEGQSSTLTKDNVTIVNNVGIADIVKVTGLASEDVINIYDTAKGGALLGTGTVQSYSTDVSVSITQLGTASGSVFISLTSKGNLESDRVQADYTAEGKTSAPTEASIKVTNNAGIADTVRVTGRTNGDVVNIYDTAKGGTPIGTGTVSTYDTEVTITITQLGASGGSIYVSVSGTSKLESDRTAVTFASESKSAAPAAGNINVTNNAGKPGTVKVKGLVDADVVRVYDYESEGTMIGTGTVSTYNTEVTIEVTQLGASAGSVYVTVTGKGKQESDRTKADFAAKAASTAPAAGDITIENNAGLYDTVILKGLSVGDIVKVYNEETGGEELGAAIVPENSMQAVVGISQLGSSSGSVYVSVTNSGKIESSRTKADYSAESASDAPLTGNITIVNNSGSSDTVKVIGLMGGDMVKVYNSSDTTTYLGTATVAGGDMEAIVVLRQIGSASGSVYVSVTSLGKTESTRTKADYKAESEAPQAANIYIVNNAVIADEVTVSGLVSGDLVKIYDSAQEGNLLGYTTLAPNSSQVEIKISQLTSSAGSIYVSVTSFGKSESSRTKADYIAEQSSNAVYIGNISVINNPSGTSDTVTVTELKAGDMIKVYDSSKGGSLLGYATVSSNSTQATISISQIGINSGSVYVSVTSLGKTESNRTTADFLAE